MAQSLTVKRKVRQPQADGTTQPPEREVLYCGALRVDVAARRAFVGDEIVDLQPKVFDLLMVLLREPGVVHTRESLFQRVWPGAVLLDGNLSSALSQLRRVLDPDNRQRLRTVPRVGYAFDGEVRRDEETRGDQDSAVGDKTSCAQGSEGGADPLRLGSALASSGSVEAGRATRWRRAFAAGATAAALLVLSATFWLLRANTVTRPVLVLEILSHGEDSSRWIELALRDGLLRRLAAEPDLRIVDREGAIGAQLLGGAASGAGGADFLLRAEHTPADQDVGHVGVSLLLFDATNGSIRLKLEESISPLDLPSRLDALAVAVRAEILPASQAVALARALIPPAAVEAYLQALRAESRTDYVDARESLQRAVTLAPGFAEAEVRLAEILRQLGYHTLAAGMYRRLADDPGNLGAESRAVAEARAHLLGGDIPSAVFAYRRLCATYPDEPRHAIEMARALARGGPNEWREARALLDSLPSQTSIPELEVRRLLVLGLINEREGRLGEAAAVFSEAAERAAAHGLDAHHGDALADRGRMRQKMQQPAEARADYKASAAAYARARLPLRTASAELNLLLLERWADPPVDAAVLQARIEAFGQQARYDFGASHLAAQGSLVLAEHRGFLADELAMRDLARSAREQFEELGDTALTSTAAIFEARAEIALGRPHTALALLEAIPERPGEGNPERHSVLLTQSRALAGIGSLERALASADQALREAASAARPDLARSAQCLRLELLLSLGSNDLAEAALAGCGADVANSGAVVRLAEVRQAFNRGDVSALRLALANAAHASDRIPESRWRDRFDVSLAEVLVSAGALHEARERLGRVDSTRIASDTPAYRAQYASVQAVLSAYLDDDPGQAAIWVNRASGEAVLEEGLARVWIDLLQIALETPRPDDLQLLKRAREAQARALSFGSVPLAQRASSLATEIATHPDRRPGRDWLSANTPGLATLGPRAERVN